ncbi:MAG: hypothetical protein HFJ09_03445 [Lachnospiraceae bacterium]|nr:hypothetical protein [Lachnospiraceae bacterium]
MAMKNDKLIEAFGGISDNYIEEALETPEWKKKKYRKILGMVALLCIILGTYFWNDNSYQVGETEKKTSEIQESILASLKVTVYAAESKGTIKEREVVLKEGNPVLLSKYNSCMSSVPAMPFCLNYEGTGEKIRMRVFTDKQGILQKWEVLNGEIWEKQEESYSLECESGEKVYWHPKKMTEKESVITIEVYLGEKCVKTQYIIIKQDTEGNYMATLEGKKTAIDKK